MVRNAGPKYVLSTSVLHYLETVYITWLDMPVCYFAKKTEKSTIGSFFSHLRKIELHKVLF